MKTQNTMKRYLLVMGVGVAIDLVCYFIAHYAQLPAWMDANGTAYAAMLLEPAAGLFVGFLINFFKATFVYSSQDLIAYFLNASVALIFGIGMRKGGIIQIKRLFPMAGLFVVVNTLLGTLIGLWQGGLISGWEHQFMELALSWGFAALPASFFGVMVLKAVDAVIMILILWIGYRLTPKAWMNQQTTSLVSWDTPYFKQKTSSS